MTNNFFKTVGCLKTAVLQMLYVFLGQVTFLLASLLSVRCLGLSSMIPRVLVGRCHVGQIAVMTDILRV